MATNVLHVLSQRPSLTGSGVTLDALVRRAHEAGWEQRVVCALPAGEAIGPVGGLSSERIHPLVFGQGELDFAVPGMSDVMPYESTVFSCMAPEQLERYRRAWLDHLRGIAARYRPDLIHVHHLWIVAALVKDAAPGVPVVDHCHATGLRQMELCAHLADEVRSGCARNDRFAVLTRSQAASLAETLGVGPARIRVVGAGYREDLFHAEGIAPDRGERLAYAGKYSAAKGLPELLAAFERLRRERPALELHVAGSGAGAEAEALRARMAAMAGVVLHGQLDQADLAGLLRACAVFVLPSFYEGLSLVLVEAAACGCTLVAPDLPWLRAGVGAELDEIIERVAPPPMDGVDRPAPAGLPAFTRRMEAACDRALARSAEARPADLGGRLSAFTWAAVFERVERVWRELI